jgi:hypothetical protein
MREKSVSTQVTLLPTHLHFKTDEFFVDDIEELDAGRSDAGQRYDRLSSTEASDLGERARDFAEPTHQTRQYVGEDCPMYLRLPAQNDPDLWAVAVRVSASRSICTYYLTLSRLDPR